MMKTFPKIIGTIMLIVMCIVFCKYKLSISVRYNQAKYFSTAERQDTYGPRNMQTSEYLGSYRDQEIMKEIIALTVSDVQKINDLSPDVVNLLTKEFISKFSKILTSSLKNGISRDEKEQRSLLVKESATQSPQSVLPYKRNNRKLDPLYIITATYRRPEQIAELTRMSHTLMLVENVHWLVIEDAQNLTPQVAKLLNRTGLVFEHLFAPMPAMFEQMKHSRKPRGVSNRNRGLQWIRANATKGVFYFADDDNTYDIDLFEEIRRTKKVSMFPVGLCTRFGVSSPIVKDGKFAGFYDGWTDKRKFPVDMAGFAVNVEFLLNRPNATMPYRAGFEEDGFLKSLAPLEPREIELLADNCTRILAWHTQTKRNRPSASLDMELHRLTNLIELKQQIV